MHNTFTEQFAHIYSAFTVASIALSCADTSTTSSPPGDWFTSFDHPASLNSPMAWCASSPTNWTTISRSSLRNIRSICSGSPPSMAAKTALNRIMSKNSMFAKVTRKRQFHLLHHRRHRTDTFFQHMQIWKEERWNLWQGLYLQQISQAFTAVQNKLWTFNRSLIIKDLGQAFTNIQNVVGL